MVKPAELIDVCLPSSLSLVDRRTFNALLRNAWPRISENGAEHVISISELKGLHTGSNHRIARTIKSLMSAVIEVKVRGKKGVEVTRRAQMLGGNDMHDEEGAAGILRYTFDPRLVSIIRSSTTWGQLRNRVMSTFSSKYALPLYEMLEKRIHLRKIEEEIPLEVLRGRLGIGSHLVRYADLNRRALRPAIEEVNTFAIGFTVSCIPLVKGKSVVGVRLIWRKKTEEERQKAEQEINGVRIGRKGRLKKAVASYEQRREMARQVYETGLLAAATMPADYLNDDIPDF